MSFNLLFSWMSPCRLKSDSIANLYIFPLTTIKSDYLSRVNRISNYFGQHFIDVPTLFINWNRVVLCLTSID